VGIEWRGPIPEANYTVGRDGNSIDLIVDHWTVVMFEGAVRRFRNPTSRLSAHYIIGQDGRIAQLVSEDDTAYHSGNYAVNLRSIGIEHEAGPAMAPTDTLYAASARLPLEIANRYGLTLDLERIVREGDPQQLLQRGPQRARRRDESAVQRLSVDLRASQPGLRRLDLC